MSKSSRYWLRLTSAFVNRFKLLFLVGIGVGLLAFLGLTYIIPFIGMKTEKIGIVGEYTIYKLPDSVLSLIGSGLTKLDSSGQVNPGIAKSWETSDSGKTWTFHLNDNLKWQDGTNVIANDIKYNFTDATLARPDKYTIV